jgi:hypothetical protein
MRTRQPAAAGRPDRAPPWRVTMHRGLPVTDKEWFTQDLLAFVRG